MPLDTGMKSDERGMGEGMARHPRPETAPAAPPPVRPITIGEGLARELAVKAQVCPKSIQREYLRPGSVRGMSGRRARETLIEAGYLPPEARAV